MTVKIEEKVIRELEFRWLFVAGAVLLLGSHFSGQTRMERTSSGEESHEQTHLGYPQDWSSGHLLMPGMRAEDVLRAGDREPRYVYNMVMRQVAVENLRHHRLPRRAASDENRLGGFAGERLRSTESISCEIPVRRVRQNCNTDYIVFGLTVTSGTQANLVGINNLYTGATPPCNSASPWVAFAYNTVTQTGGQIETSPTLSTDGTKVAFVESTSGASYFHVLVLPNPIPIPPAQSGTVLSPMTPTSCTTPTTVGCMTTLTIETTATNSNSSPWVDYNSDTAYVGADNGLLYKITPVFGGGAPALISTGGWPATVSTNATNKALTGPVVDDTTGRIFLGDGYGYFYAVNLTNPGTSMAQVGLGWVGHQPGTGVVDPPFAVTDPANSATDQVFAFTGCSSVLGLAEASASSQRISRVPPLSQRAPEATRWIWDQPAGPATARGKRTFRSL